MEVAVIISLSILVITFLGFMINIRKEITNSYNEAKNALSEQINILKEKNDILDRLTYKNYLEDIAAIKEVYESKINLSKSAVETTPLELGISKINTSAIEEIDHKFESLARDISLQFENKSNGFLKIISPKETTATEEWVDISGIGAPSNYKILLFTWLKNKFSSLQSDISTSDSNGNWFNQKCHLYNVDSDREIYAIAVEPAKVSIACDLYKKYGKLINPIIFQTILEKNRIDSIVSIGKRLIRSGK